MAISVPIDRILQQQQSAMDLADSIYRTLSEAEDMVDSVPPSLVTERNQARDELEVNGHRLQRRDVHRDLTFDATTMDFT